MGSQASAARSHRSSLRKRVRNQSANSAVKTIIRKFNGYISSGDIAGASSYMPTVVTTLDKAAQKGILHMNNAARRKSRLILKLNAAQASKPVAAPTNQRQRRAPAKPS